MTNQIQNLPESQCARRKNGLENELGRLAERLQPIFRRRGVQRAIVFGSLARGDATRRSDLDLVLIVKTAKRFLDRYDDLLAPIAKAVPERAVELLIYTPQELEQISHRRFVASALREGKTIYESGQEPA